MLLKNFISIFQGDISPFTLIINPEKDPILSRVHHLVLHGLTASSFEPDLQPYFIRKNELSVVDGCVLWGSRVVIPPPDCAIVLNQLHDTHFGINKMKSLAHSYVWWPKLDADIMSKM